MGLDEALQIIGPTLRGQRPSFDGKWYHTENAINESRIRDDLPIMLGESGERKTFALAARFASASTSSAGCAARWRGSDRSGCGTAGRSGRRGMAAVTNLLHRPVERQQSAPGGVSHYPLAVSSRAIQTPKRMHSARCTAELDLTKSVYSPFWWHRARRAES